MDRGGLEADAEHETTNSTTFCELPIPSDAPSEISPSKADRFNTYVVSLAKIDEKTCSNGVTHRTSYRRRNGGDGTVMYPDSGFLNGAFAEVDFVRSNNELEIEWFLSVRRLRWLNRLIESATFSNLSYRRQSNFKGASLEVSIDPMW
jgi:hypothetical protein